MLELRDVSKSFGDTPVLKDISLSLRDGETTVVLGPSGSGKSTLLRTMNLLEIPESGSLSINGDSVTFGGTLTRKQVSAIRRRSAMVFQGYNLFPHQSVRDNVAVPPVLNGKTDRAAARVRAEELLDKVGMAHRLDEYPDNLSGGQQQRVAIARALMQHPRILLADEPVASLDPVSAHEVMSLLKGIAQEQGLTVIASLHQVQLAIDFADRIVGLRAGRIVLNQSTRGMDAVQASRIYENVSGVPAQGRAAS